MILVNSSLFTKIPKDIVPQAVSKVKLGLGVFVQYRADLWSCPRVGRESQSDGRCFNLFIPCRFIP